MSVFCLLVTGTIVNLSWLSIFYVSLCVFKPSSMYCLQNVSVFILLLACMFCRTFVIEIEIPATAAAAQLLQQRSTDPHRPVSLILSSNRSLLS